MSITYRLLQPDEWHRLSSFIDSKFIPHPSTANAAVAIDDNNDIVGVLIGQLAVHFEPLKLASPRVNFERLFDVLYNATGMGVEFYAFSNSDIVGKMAEHVGMERLPFAVYRGRTET